MLLPQPQTQPESCLLNHPTQRIHHPRRFKIHCRISHVLYSFRVLDRTQCRFLPSQFLCVDSESKPHPIVKGFPSSVFRYTIQQPNFHIWFDKFLKFMKYKFYYVWAVNHFDKIFSSPFWLLQRLKYYVSVVFIFMDTDIVETACHFAYIFNSHVLSSMCS